MEEVLSWKVPTRHNGLQRCGRGATFALEAGAEADDCDATSRGGGREAYLRVYAVQGGGKGLRNDNMVREATVSPSKRRCVVWSA